MAPRIIQKLFLAITSNSTMIEKLCAILFRALDPIAAGK
jgi:hypothetical protein